MCRVVVVVRGMDSVVENHNGRLVSKPKHPYSDICAGLHENKAVLKELQARNPEKMQLVDEQGSSRSLSTSLSHGGSCL